MKKHAIVTGGTRGIGYAIVEMLIEEGYRVTLTYGHDESGATACRERLAARSADVELFRVDQSDPSQVAEFAATMRQQGAVDCLVLNAGTTFRHNSLEDVGNDDWERVMMVNVNTPFYLVRDLQPVMPNGSRIVFIASEMAVYPHSLSLAYGVSKSAVVAMAKNLVKYFEGTDTTVNAVAPGFVETEWQRTKAPEIRESICRKTAVGRFGSPAEVADAVRFCLHNAFVNGSLLELNGGYCFK